MRAHVPILATAIVLAAALPATAQTASPADVKPGSISGRITAAETGKPLRRARVTLMSAAESTGAPPITANTNAAGYFEAKNVPPGSYYVAAVRAGYLNVQYGQRRPTERGLTVELLPSQTLGRIDLSLPRGGVLAGRITDELGEPYPGVRVDALATRYSMGRRVRFPAGVATTDDLGQFRLAGLPPGTYYVAASSTETWRTEKKETYGYASTYFPGGPPDQAQAITLALSQERSDLHFSLHAGRAARITGRLLRETGEPIAAGQVTLAYTDPGGGMMTAGMRSVRTERDGSFELKDVPGGMFCVGCGGAEQIVTVDGADIENLVLVSKTGSTVLGTLTTDDGAPPFPLSGVRVLLEAPYEKVLPTVRVVSVDTDLSFKLTNLGGPFLFRVRGLPDGWTLGSVRMDDKDITDSPWDVPTGGKNFSGLQIVVTQKIGRLLGNVVDSTGKPSSGATVVVFSDQSDLWMPGSRFISTTRPASDGHFSITGLPAGTFRAIARELVEDGQQYDRTFLEEARDGATRFVLGEGASEAITLKLPATQRQ
jgi:hypothetical protein